MGDRDTAEDSARSHMCSLAGARALLQNAALCKSKALGFPKARRRSSPSGSSCAALSRSGPLFSKRLPLVCSSRERQQLFVGHKQMLPSNRGALCSVRILHCSVQKVQDVTPAPTCSRQHGSAASSGPRPRQAWCRRPSSPDPPRHGDLSTVSGDAWLGWPWCLQEQTVDKWNWELKMQLK